MRYFRFTTAWLVAALLPAASFAGAETSAPPAGVTMRITQQIALGDLSTSTDYRASFLPPDGFRVEGTMQIAAMEMKMKMVIVGDAKQIRQITETPFGPQAFVVDLDPIRKAIPEYSPSSSYDPAAYKKMLDTVADKKSLPGLKLDGVQTKGYEFPLPGGRLSLPSNVPMGMPEPAGIRIWLYPKDGIARKIEMLDAQGNVFVTTIYTDVKTGVSISKKAFALKFPEGVTPLNITDMVLGSVTAQRATAQEKHLPPQEKAPATADNETKGVGK